MKFRFSVALIIAFLSTSFMATAQDCTFFFPTKVGTVLEYTNFDKKGRTESVQEQKVLEKKQEGNATVVVVEQTLKADKKGEEDIITSFEVKCEDGMFYMNMNDFTKGMNYDQYEDSPDVDVVVETDGVYFPSDLSVGQTMDDANIEISVNASGMTMFNTSISILNRKAEANESVTTSAGTFSCMKITSDIITKAMMKFEVKSVQWIVEGIGIVKSETYNKKGKLISSQELTKITE